MIGITELTFGWDQILNQIGAQFELVNSEEELTNFKVLIIPSEKTKLDKNSLNTFVNEGGSILTNAIAANNLFGFKKKKVNIKYAVPGIEGIFSNIRLLDIYGSSQTTTDANEMPNQDEQNIIYKGKLGKGSIVVLPEGFESAIFDLRTVRKNFISKWSERFPNERVSQVSKGGITSTIRIALEHLFHSAGLPFVHLWFYPNGERTIFNFRIDTDFGTEKDVFDLYSILDKHQIPGTWFIEVKSKEKWLSKFKKFSKQELAYHCYRHKMTGNISKNKQDFEAGLKLLSENEVDVNGYAAPYGEWNDSIGLLSEEFGFQYSSEFGYSYDGLPFYPLIDNRPSKVLQIPIHPISTNRLKHAGTSSENLINYFIDTIERKISNFEPLFFYTHPFEKEYDFFNSLFEEISHRKIYNTTLIDYANWWKGRLNKSWKIDFENGNLTIDTDNVDESYMLRVSEASGNHYLIPLKQDFDASQKIKLEITQSENFEVDYKNLRKYSYKMFKHDILFKMRKMQQ